MAEDRYFHNLTADLANALPDPADRDRLLGWEPHPSGAGLHLSRPSWTAMVFPWSTATQTPIPQFTMGNRPSSLPVPTETSHISSGGQSSQSTNTTDSSSQALDQHTCNKPMCAVTKCLETTELLENILTFLPTKDVLELQLVSSKWRQLIQKSPPLRLHRFITPQWRCPAVDFRLLSLALPGLEIRRGEAIHLGQWVEVKMTLAAAEAIQKTAKRPRTFHRSLMFANDFEDPRRGTVQASSPVPEPADLLLTQPPIIGLQAFVINVSEGDAANTGSSSDVPAAHSKISCDAGITLGFMADVAEELLRKPRRGRAKRNRAAATEHQEGRAVLFKAIVSFCTHSDVAPRKRSVTRIVTGIE